MKKIFLIMMLCVSSLIFAAEKRYNTDSIHFRILYDGQFSEQPAVLFEKEFNAAAEEIFSSLKVKQPLSYNVVLCYGAWIFKKETGFDEHTAGIFIPSRNIFVFQNPQALLRKNILASTIRHELCHAAVASYRASQGAFNDSDKMWLEESFCTALYPAAEYSVAAGRELMVAMKGDDAKVAAYVTKAIRSADYAERRKGYSLAYVYGNAVLKKKGVDVFLRSLL
jgi:hypothetical protein